MEKRYAFAGLLGVGLSSLTIIVMAALRTDGYDHLHKAVSELGSLDAPDRWVFNTLGYLLPGLLVSCFAFGLGQLWSYKHGVFVYSLLFSGLFLLLAGVFPMDSPVCLTTDTTFPPPLPLVTAAGAFGSNIALSL